MKKIIKSICFSFLAFMFALGSIFLPLGKQNSKYANAETSGYDYNFTTNEFYAPLWHNGNSFLEFSNCLFSASSSYNSASNKITFAPKLRYYDFYNDTTINYYNYYNVLTLAPSSDPNAYTFYDNYVTLTPGTSYHIRFTSSRTAVNQSYFSGYIYSDVGFNCNVYKVTISIVDKSDEFCFVSFKYYDLNDNTFDIQIYSHDSIQLSTRTYFFANPSLLTDNQYYNEGYNTGKSEGISIGENQGYSSGYNTGYDDGFETGKIEGVIESNDYSFFGLISAIIDAPVTILTSLFNFNFLGVNLWAFFTSILTISLVIFVIRKFMAKG